MSLSPGESDLLRQLVREVLSEVVPQAMASAAVPHAESQAAASTRELVRIASDDDLQSFARRIALASDAVRAAVIAGDTTFGLVRDASRTTAPGPEGASVVRIDRGAVTERHVRDAASTGSSIHLGRKAVLTPLARDRARADGVEITKER
jgi:hypothetical protein